MPRRELRGDGGSSTVLALGLVAVLLTLTVAALSVLGAVHAVHVARSSADLAALAAATAHQQSPDESGACAEAGRIARRHDAELVSCEVEAGGQVTVTTSVAVPHRLAGVGPERAEGRARAGPEPGGADRRTGDPEDVVPGRGQPPAGPGRVHGEGGHRLDSEDPTTQAGGTP